MAWARICSSISWPAGSLLIVRNATRPSETVYGAPSTDLRFQPGREQADDVHVLRRARAAIGDANLVDRFFADRDRAGRIAHVELEVGERHDVGDAELVVGEIARGRGGGDRDFVLARRAHRAAEFHVTIVARTERADAPGDFAIGLVEHMAFAGADELGAGRQVDLHRHVVGRGGAWIANAEEVRRGRAGILRLRTAPIDFQLRLAAEEFLRRLPT